MVIGRGPQVQLTIGTVHVCIVRGRAAAAALRTTLTKEPRVLLQDKNNTCIPTVKSSGDEWCRLILSATDIPSHIGENRLCPSSLAVRHHRIQCRTHGTRPASTAAAPGKRRLLRPTGDHRTWKTGSPDKYKRDAKWTVLLFALQSLIPDTLHIHRFSARNLGRPSVNCHQVLPCVRKWV